LNKIFNFLFFTAFYFGSIFPSDIEFEADTTFTLLKEWIKKASQIEKSNGNLG